MVAERWMRPKLQSQIAKVKNSLRDVRLERGDFAILWCDHRKTVANPQRYFTTVNCRTAKGLVNHIVGGEGAFDVLSRSTTRARILRISSLSDAGPSGGSL